jgi:sugar lactone lactonase YvrE
MGNLILQEADMFNLQQLVQWERKTRRAVVLMGGLLAALVAVPIAYATTYVTVDGHPEPVALTVGETVTIRFDVAKANGSVTFGLFRDLARAGRFDPAKFDPTSDPSIFFFTITDGGSFDSDPTPGKVTHLIPVTPAWPAGTYFARFQDASDGSAVTIPLWTVVPKPEPQVISGHVAVAPTGTVPPDAVVWAAKDLQTPVASADIKPDGSYTLPVPPGTYLVFAEWFGNLRSQRQVVNLVAGQQQNNVDLPMLQGQEVSGTVTDRGQPMRDALVQATAANGQSLAARTLSDGGYVFVLPAGQYRITAPGGAEMVTVTHQPIDGVDFPAPTPGPAPVTGTIITVAGSGNRGYGGDGRRATAARFSLILGMAVDPAGNIYVADRGVGRIRRVDAATGIITTVVGSGSIETIRGLSALGNPNGFSGDNGPAVASQTNFVQNLAVDKSGNLYIGDFLNHRVRKADARTGIITTVAGSGPVGDGKGSLSGDGGPATAATLNGVQGLALDAAGNLFINDGRNRRIRRVDAATGIITTVAGGGTNPLVDGAKATEVALPANLGGALAVDLEGNLIFGISNGTQIFKVNRSGILSTIAGTPQAGYSGDGGPATAAQLRNPSRFVLDRVGNLYFSDQNNNRIRKISPEGIITTVAGNGESGFGGDGGPAGDAKLSAPVGVGIDGAGNLYLVDQLNARIRKVAGIAAPGLFGGQ